MRSAYARWLLVAALATAGSAVASGCANDQETINRVQPNALKKSTLDGEWYYLQTVIDTPSTSSYTFVGDQGDVNKITWEIQENYLIARRNYEFIAGAEKPNDGTPNDAAKTAVAQYKILSHFDIRRDYNPATGEQTNVISENTVDRPWNEREFMRVDWSENLITDGGFMLYKQVLDGIEVESSYFPQTGENAPQFVQGEDGTVNYVDIVNKMFVKPTEIDIPGFGKVPTCLLGENVDICEAGEVTVRNSFRKVEDTDFQPVNYTGDRMERFGFFVHERMGYSDDYGNVESERYRFAEVHNLWKQSHLRNDEGKLIACESDAQCGKVKAQSKCDQAWGMTQRRYNTKNGAPLGVCTIPYREREIRPVVYYATNLPEELQVDIDTIGAEWNAPFVETVSSLRENECLAAGGKADACAAERKRADHQKIFYLCATPVAEGAPEACGEVGFKPKPGDLRYSQLYWVNSEEGGGPLGYGPGHSDPETGETLMGNAFIYGSGVERYAARARDTLALLNGDLSVADFQAGDYLTAWAQSAHSRAESSEAADTGDRHFVDVTPESLARTVKSMNLGLAGAGSTKQAPRSVAELRKAFKDSLSRLHGQGQFGSPSDDGAARLARLKGTDIEAMLVTPEMLAWAGLDPTTATLDEETLEAASPLRSKSMEAMRAIEATKKLLSQKIGYYDAEFNDEGIIGLAHEIKEQAKKKNGSVEWFGKKYVVSDGSGQVDYEAVRRMVYHPMFHGLALHEIGHSVGLRHNFSGSYDAVNYNPEYWKLRDDGKMAPRFWDPITEKEKNGRIREYQYSTVMDYGNNFLVTDAAGLGHYDHAAIKMGYGDMVEVFKESPDHSRVAGIGVIQSFGWPIMLDLTKSTSTPVAVPYTEWPALVGGRANLEKRADVPYTSLKADGSIGIDEPAVDQQGRAAVPYRFCSDEQRDLNPDCTLYDAGADPFESVQSTVDTYWNYYPFLSFRRQRVGFGVNGVVNAVMNRYFEKIKRAHQTFALYQPIFSDIFGLKADAPFWTEQTGMGAWTAASQLGFDALTRVVTTPEPGTYAKSKRLDGTEVLVPATQFPEVTIDTLDGRYLETTYDTDAGYYWFDQLDHVGYFYDKVLAMMAIVDPTTYFVGRDTDADIRKYQINYARTFPGPLNSFFRAVLSEDWLAIAPRVTGSGATTQVVYPELDQIEKRNMAGTPISPNVSFSIQLYGAVLGMGYIPQTYDQSFLNSSRVWVTGGAEEVAVDPGATLVTFTDPDSLLTYAAVSEIDAEGIEQGVGASLVTYAKTLFEKAAGVDGILGTADDNVAGRETAARFVDNLDLVRRLTWQLGFGAQP